MTIEVVHARVFALDAAGGNPCPVVLAADALGADAMQAVAHHFGLDTVFVLRPRAPGAQLRLRYFLPAREMGFSGHATVAALQVWQAQAGALQPCLRFETANGVFAAHLTAHGDALEVTLATGAPTFLRRPPAAQAAAALGVPTTALDLALGPVQTVAAPRAKVLVPLRDQAALDGLVPDFALLWELCERWQATGFYPFTVRPGYDADARQFPYRAGFAEDAATGVAAAALAAYLARYRPQPGAAAYEFSVLQGRAMGAASRITARATVRDGQVVATEISGQAVITGRERLDPAALAPVAARQRAPQAEHL